MKKSDIHILILEDDANFRASLVETVKRFGFKALPTGKPDEALNLAKIKQIHVAIVDCLLPKMNGVDLVKEIRETPFGKAPVLLMSGVFRDASFIEGAMKKSEALEFFSKPMDLKKLKTTLDKAVEDLLDAHDVPLNALLSKAYSASRDRIKALTALEEVSGFDLPYVLSILMNEKVSGYLNLSTQEGDIFGMTFVDGALAKVDGTDTQKRLREILIESGLVSAEEIEGIPKEKRRGDIVKALIEESLISPHSARSIVDQQILGDLRQLLTSKKFNFSLSPDTLKDAGDFLSFQKLIPLLHDVVMTHLNPEYLGGFYAAWRNFPVRKGSHFTANNPNRDLQAFQNAKEVFSLVAQEMTLHEILSQSRLPEGTALQAIHMMALLGMIYFDDVKTAQKSLEHFRHLQEILGEVENKNPFEMYVYFGASPEAKPAEVEKIYKEFAKANHPDMVPATAPEDLRLAVSKLFSIMSSAHDVLVEENQRKKYLDGIRQVEYKKQIEAESLSEQAMGLLKKGQLRGAQENLKKAYELYKDPGILIKLCWVRLKSFPKATPPTIIKEVANLMDSVPHTERRNAAYQYVLGLMRKAQGDNNGAIAMFERALLLDANFADAKSELETLKADKKSLLNGDISGIVSGLFKRK